MPHLHPHCYPTVTAFLPSVALRTPPPTACLRLCRRPPPCTPYLPYTPPPPLPSHRATPLRRACMVSTNAEESPPGPEPLPAPSRRTAATAVAAVAATVLLCMAVSRRAALASLISHLVALAARLGPVRGAALLAATNFCTVLLCFPANMGLMIGAGALLGPAPAFAALFVSKTAAALVAFSLARGVLNARVARWLEAYPKMARVLRESGRDGGWRFVILMRLSPFPGFLLNYLLSLTGVSFAEYAFGTFVGVAPSILNLVLVGSTAKDVGVGVTAGAPSTAWLGTALKALCMLAMVVVTVVITRKARQAFAELDEENAPTITAEETP